MLQSAIISVTAGILIFVELLPPLVKQRPSKRRWSNGNTYLVVVRFNTIPVSYFLKKWRRFELEHSYDFENAYEVVFDRNRLNPFSSKCVLGF